MPKPVKIRPTSSPTPSFPHKQPQRQQPQCRKPSLQRQKPARRHSTPPIKLFKEIHHATKHLAFQDAKSKDKFTHTLIYHCRKHDSIQTSPNICSLSHRNACAATKAQTRQRKTMQQTATLFQNNAQGTTEFSIPI